MVCQDQTLSKDQYHKLLAEAKIIFSASLQETLGIGCYEGCLLDALPLVPNRLSYTEMYLDQFKYPSKWTDNWDSYLEHKNSLVEHIHNMMTNYDNIRPLLVTQNQILNRDFFSASQLINKFVEYN